MDIWNVYAYISNGKAVCMGVFNAYNGGLEKATQYAQEGYGAEAFAVNVNQVPVEIDDVYDNGKFYRGGVEVKTCPTVEDHVLDHEEAIDDLVIAVLGG